MTPMEIRYTDLVRRIRAEASQLPPEFRNYADANADVEIADIRERLMSCSTERERDDLLFDWLSVWGTT